MICTHHNVARKTLICDFLEMREGLRRKTASRVEAFASEFLRDIEGLTLWL